MDLIPYNSKKSWKTRFCSFKPANFAVQNCDLLICIGARLDNVVTGFNLKDFARSGKRVVVDIDPSELSKFNDNDFLKILSDAKVFLQKIINELKKIKIKDNKEWLLKCNSWKEKYGVNDGKPFKNNGPITHSHIVDTLSKK